MVAMAAVDLGAESGRVVLGRFDGARLQIEEVHRFPNEPVRLLGRLRWDLPRLFLEMQRGLALARRAAGGPLACVAVDTWGVDFALLGEDGEILGHPYHYRALASEQAMREAFAMVPAREIFEVTGIQLIPINTLFQLIELRRVGPAALGAARRLLMLPGAFTYLLTGQQLDEFTIATTSQLYDPTAGDWAWRLVDALGLPRHLFGEVIPPGTLVGPLEGGAAAETGLEGARVALTAGHDTACAVAAVPAAEPSGWAYISSGTWSLVGIEVPAPVITDAAFSANLSNEGGVFGTFRLLRNVMGLWLLQECRRRWEQEGAALSYDELAHLAAKAPPRRSFVDPDDLRFLRPGDMVAHVQAFCRETAQPVPTERGEVVRTILESLALKYRWVIETLERVAGGRIERVHVVGGGSRNALLCQLTADVTGRPVVAGPAEATAIGNLLMQARALGEVKSLSELRDAVRRSFPTRTYEPAEAETWEEPYRYFQTHVVGHRELERPA